MNENALVTASPKDGHITQSGTARWRFALLQQLLQLGGINLKEMAGVCVDGGKWSGGKDRENMSHCEEEEVCSWVVGSQGRRSMRHEQEERGGKLNKPWAL